MQRCLVLAWNWTNDHFDPLLVVIAAIREAEPRQALHRLGPAFGQIWYHYYHIYHYISLISSKLCAVDMPFAFRRNHPFCRWKHIAQLTEFTESAFASRVLWNLRSFNNGMWLVTNISIDPTWSHLHFLFANIRHLPPIWFRWNPQVEDRRDSWEPSRQKAFNASSNALTKTSIRFVQSVGFVGCCQDPKFTNTSHGHWVSSPAEAWPLRQAFDVSSRCHYSIQVNRKLFLAISNQILFCRQLKRHRYSCRMLEI